MRICAHSTTVIAKWLEFWTPPQTCSELKVCTLPTEQSARAPSATASASAPRFGQWQGNRHPGAVWPANRALFLTYLRVLLFVYNMFKARFAFFI